MCGWGRNILICHWTQLWMESQGTCGRLVPGEGTPPPPFCIFSLGTCEGVNQKMQQIHLFFFKNLCVPGL